jgi:hypothetical protein
VIGELAREPDEDFQQELADRYATVRRFLPRLLNVITLDPDFGYVKLSKVRARLAIRITRLNIYILICIWRC